MKSIFRPARVQWLPLVLVAAAVVVGLYSISRRPADEAAAEAHELNVLLITVDTTRADRLGCYGYSAIETPHIDGLAAAGVQFTQCTSPVPVTLPAHTSIMTGVFPFAHQVRLNTSMKVDQRNVTLAEILKEKGYNTAAVVASMVLHSLYELDQGFDTYSDVKDKPSFDWRPGGGDEPQRDPDEPVLAERPGNEIADFAVQFLRTQGEKEKFFLWTHFYDPHYPCVPPEPFLSQYSDPYLGEIAFMDTQIGRILEELRRLNLAERTLVVLAGDHGEGLGEHGEDTHVWFVYDSTAHVPLIFRLPGRIGPAKLIDAQVRLVDIAPTVLDLLGYEIPSNINGTSLVPLMDGKVDDLRLEAYSETLYPMETFGFSWLRALRADGWKYIHAPKPELYDVSRDPGELDNLYAELPEKAEEYKKRLRDLIDESPVLATKEIMEAMGLSEEQQKQMEALGYVGGVTADIAEFVKEDPFDPEGADPKDRIEVIRLWTEAMGQVTWGDKVKAEGYLRQVIEQYPEIATAHLRLGDVLKSQGRLDESKSQLEHALTLAPKSAEVLRHLAAVCVELEEDEEAAEYLKRAVELKPDDSDLLYKYAAQLAELERHEDALAAYQKCDQLVGGDNAEYKYSIATTLVLLGREKEAEELFNAALDLDPHHAQTHYNLGNMMARRGETQTAVEHYEAAIAADPGFAQARINLGISLSRLGRRDEAVVELYKATTADPTFEEGFAKLSQFLSLLGRRQEAVEVLSEGLLHHPQNVSFAVNLAALLLLSPEEEIRDCVLAAQVINAAIETVGGATPELLNWLAAAFAECDEFEQAVKTAEAAASMAEAQDKPELLEQIRERVQKYQQGQPARSLDRRTESTN